MRKKFTLSGTICAMFVIACLGVTGIFLTEGVLEKISWFVAISFGFITWFGFVCENTPVSID